VEHRPHIREAAIEHDRIAEVKQPGLQTKL
jgi:hypothetical protein